MNGHDDHDDRDDGAKGNGSRRAAQRVAGGYRSATGALDERPSAQARAAILAAAAREVGAQPRDAAAGPPSARPTPVRRALRWPMAAAATVLLSSVAVMMASRVEEAQPVAESTAPPVAVPAAPPVAPAPAPAPAPASAPPAAAASPASPASMADSRKARENAAPVAPAPPRQVSAEKPSASPPMAAPSADRAAAPVAPPATPPAPFADSTRERSVMPAPPPAESAAASPSAAPTGGLSRDLATLRKPQAPTQEQPRLEAHSASASAPGAAPGAAQRADDALPDSEEAALSADDWLARIVRLRAAGRHAEADAQLQRFRLRFPQVKVPEAALPPTGTR